MLVARCRIVQAAITGIAAFDVPFRDIDDADGLRKETEAAKALGFSYKLANRSAQIAVINSVFRPGPDQIATARRMVAAFKRGGGGVCQLDGRMVDVPVVKYAWQGSPRSCAAA